MGAGTRGASKGMSGLLKASIDKGSYLFEEYSMALVPHANAILTEPTRFEFAKRISELLPVFEDVSNRVTSKITKGCFPLVLAGDHSTAAGTIAGVKVAYPDKRVGVIWIDAHADIHSPYTTPSGNMHGMPIAASLGIDNKVDGHNQPHEEVVQAWESFKNMGGISPKIIPSDVVYIGVRDTEWQEDDYILKNGIRTVSIDEFRNKSIKQTVQSVFDCLVNTDVIYVSYDVDVLDPSLSKGTGTPVANGLFLQEVKDMLTLICSHEKIVCFEMVEINPLLDEGNKMAEMAFEVLEDVIKALESK